jgi:hypothetical protein
MQYREWGASSTNASTTPKVLLGTGKIGLGYGSISLVEDQ